MQTQTHQQHESQLEMFGSSTNAAPMRGIEIWDKEKSRWVDTGIRSRSPRVIARHGKRLSEAGQSWDVYTLGE